MTKAELINAVLNNTGGQMTKKDTTEAVQAVFDNLALAKGFFPGKEIMQLRDEKSRGNDK